MAASASINIQIKTMKLNLKDHTREDIEALVTDCGEKPYRVGQIYTWLYERSVSSIDEMTDLSKDLRERLKSEYVIEAPKLVERKTSSDGTEKFLFELSDGARIETVLIPEAERLTLCVSTQAGCALGCTFCMTGEAGPGRDLTLAEMVGEVQEAEKLTGKKVTNVVLMGMGEPLLNFDEVIRFIEVLTDQKGLDVSPRRVTLSTAGVVPAIKKLGHLVNINLAVSLNATTDELRDEIMPINKKYPLKELLSALKGYPLKRRRTITIEYVLLKGLNDSIDDAKRLHKLLNGIRTKINLIPFNPFPGSSYESPDDETVKAFHKTLLDLGDVVITRASKGADIEAACGQLKGAV